MCQLLWLVLMHVLLRFLARNIRELTRLCLFVCLKLNGKCLSRMIEKISPILYNRSRCIAFSCRVTTSILLQIGFARSFCNQDGFFESALFFLTKQGFSFLIKALQLERLGKRLNVAFHFVKLPSKHLSLFLRVARSRLRVLQISRER